MDSDMIVNTVVLYRLFIFLRYENEAGHPTILHI